MKLYSLAAKEILNKGGRLRKLYWNPGDHMILHGVWFFRTTNVLTSRGAERLRLNGIDYQLYHISSDSMYESDFEEVKIQNNAGFGLEF